MSWLRSIWYRWVHRNDTLEQRKTDLKTCMDAIREEYKNEPADRVTCEAMEALDEVEETLELGQ